MGSYVIVNPKSYNYKCKTTAFTIKICPVWFRDNIHDHIPIATVEIVGSASHPAISPRIFYIYTITPLHYNSHIHTHIYIDSKKKQKNVWRFLKNRGYHVKWSIFLIKSSMRSTIHQRAIAMGNHGPPVAPWGPLAARAGHVPFGLWVEEELSLCSDLNASVQWKVVGLIDKCAYLYIYIIIHIYIYTCYNMHMGGW